MRVKVTSTHLHPLFFRIARWKNIVQSKSQWSQLPELPSLPTLPTDVPITRVPTSKDPPIRLRTWEGKNIFVFWGSLLSKSKEQSRAINASSCLIFPEKDWVKGQNLAKSIFREVPSPRKPEGYREAIALKIHFFTINVKNSNISR